MKSRFFRQFSYFYPFTLSGTLLLAAALYLTGRGLAQGNPYALLLAILALAVLAVLGLAGRIQALRFSRLPFTWDSSAALYARRLGLQHMLHSGELRTLPFFRLHFSVRGWLAVGRRSRLFIARQLAFASGALHPLPLYFPLCGSFAGTGRLAMRDIFGLTRSRFGEELSRTLTVQPAWIPSTAVPPVEPSGGFEDQSRRRSSEEEKYYMREYLPGDRFRDINWKVSSRLQELITRISPVTQEKTSVLSVFFRNFRSDRRESLESVLHLNYLKSWLLAFLRNMRRENDRLQFRVRTADSIVLLQTEEEVERFGWELAALWYQADTGSAGSGAVAQEPPESELFVFSTPFDRNLPLFLASYPQTRTYIFRTVAAVQQPRPKLPAGLMVAPKAAGAIVESRKEQPLRLFEAGVEIQEAFVPGLWAFRRERVLASPKVGAWAQSGRQQGLRPQGALTEEALEVRVFA